MKQSPYKTDLAPRNCQSTSQGGAFFWLVWNSTTFLIFCLFVLSLAVSSPAHASSNSCQALFSKSIFQRLFAEKIPPPLEVGFPEEVPNFVNSLATRSEKIKTLLTPRFLKRYWGSEESNLISEKVKLVYNAHETYSVDITNTNLYFDFETDSFSGSMHAYFDSSSRENLVLHVDQIGIKVDGTLLNDGDQTGALSSQFAKFLVSMTRVVYESSVRYSQIKSARIQANVVNTRLRSSLETLGFSEKVMLLPSGGQYWLMATKIDLPKKE